MKLKLKLVAASIAVLGVLGLNSCKEEAETAKPVITLIELGLGNNHIGYIGADLHIEADIIAEGKIDVVSVEIHQEDGGTYEIEATFDEFSGLKNTTFHKHIDILADAPAGAYHFHLTVTDLEGNSTTVEEDMTIEELVDDVTPVLTISSAPTEGQSFANGERISIAGTVTDNVTLAGMFIGVVYESDNIADADVTGANTSVIAMLHTHAFDSDTSDSFTASIAVGAANDNNMTPAPIQGANAWRTGNYYILVRVVDAKGNWTFSQHYPIVVTL